MLTIENLSKTYSNGVKALDKVSLEIGSGLFGLLGPNGAGKSTLMRIIATLQEPDCGSVRMGQIDCLKDKQALKRQLGYLPQEFGFYPKEKAAHLLEHFAFLKGIPDRKIRKNTVETLLKRVNLWENRNQKIGTYSGGMKQRFGIAISLLGDPGIIIVDEPTAGLDPGERNRFHNLLSEIGEQIIVILSTHIVDDVSDLCTDMAIIDKGIVIMKANPEETIRAIAGKIWKKTIRKSNFPDYSDRYTCISSKLKAGRTILHIYSETHPDNGFEPVEPCLEDVYFHQLSQREAERM